MKISILIFYISLNFYCISEKQKETEQKKNALLCTILNLELNRGKQNVNDVAFYTLTCVFNNLDEKE